VPDVLLGLQVGRYLGLLQPSSFQQLTQLLTLCLAFSWACRTLTPLIGYGDRVFILFIAVLAVESVAYGLTPMAIAGQQDWVFTIFRVLSGGGFATLTANITPLVSYATTSDAKQTAALCSC
jgi:hypothetical protein